MTHRPEDYTDVVRSAARRQARKMPGIDEDDLYGAAMESLCRSMPADDGARNYRGLVYRVACCRMVDDYRAWRHLWGESLAPLSESLDDPGHPCFDAPAPSAEDEAMRAIEVAAALACLTTFQRRVALAAMESGGQRRLAAEIGVTESALSHHRSAIRRRLAAYRRSAA